MHGTHHCDAEREMGLYGGLLDEEKDTLRHGIVRESFLNTYLRARAEAGHAEAFGNGTTTDAWMRDTMLAYTAGTILEAGSDTTATAILTFVLLMLSYPHVLKRAREEIDSVVGEDQMPTFDDEEKLPYIVACVQEMLRCHPPIIMGTCLACYLIQSHRGHLQVYRTVQMRMMNTRGITFQKERQSLGTYGRFIWILCGIRTPPSSIQSVS